MLETLFFMFRIVKLLFVFFLFLISHLGFAQPNACTNLPTGVQSGGDFDFNPASGSLCLPTGTLSSDAIAINKTDATLPAGAVSNIFYVFETPATTTYNVLRLSPQFIPAVAGAASHTYTPGSYWVLQSIQVNSTTYIKCKEFVVIAKHQPEANISLCGKSSALVKIPIHTNNNDTHYEINWGDGSPIEIVDVATTPLPITKPHTYSSSTIPSVSVLGRYIKNGTELCPGTPPASGIPQPVKTPFISRLESINNGTGALINFENATPGHSYDIMAKPDDGVSTWAVVGTASVVGTATNGSATVTGLTANQKYCFKLSSQDKCGTPINSNEVCSIVLNAVPATSSTANLSWNLPSSPVGIPTKTEYWQDVVTGGGGTSVVLGQVATSATASSLDCSKKYVYQVKVDYNLLGGGNVTVLSNIPTVDPTTAGVSSIIPSDLFFVGYDELVGSKVKLNIQRDPFKPKPPKYYFYRAEEGSSNYIKIGDSNENTFEDINVPNNNKKYCYKYQYENECGQLSPLSKEACTILLSVNTLMDVSNNKRNWYLDWTPYELDAAKITNSPFYNAFQIGTASSINRYPITTTNLDITDLINSATSPQLSFRVSGHILVEVLVSGNPISVPIASYSNTVKYIFPTNIYLPTAFTPNGSNPEFYPTFNRNIVPDANMNMQVFDRWGSVVFDSVSAGTYKWDGKINGVDAPVGTYAYTVSGKSVLDIPFSQSGTFMLLR